MTRPKQPQAKTIDPNFYIPDGLIDLVYDDGNSPDGLVSEAATDEALPVTFDNLVDNDDTASTDPFDSPEVPGAFTIVSQTHRFAPDGSQVVDLVIRVDDVPGVTTYDVRKTKSS